MKESEGPPTWERIMALARNLELASLTDSAPPRDVAALVRMLVQFDRRLTALRRPSSGGGGGGG